MFNKSYLLKEVFKKIAKKFQVNIFQDDILQCDILYALFLSRLSWHCINDLRWRIITYNFCISRLLLGTKLKSNRGEQDHFNKIWVTKNPKLRYWLLNWLARVFDICAIIWLCNRTLLLALFHRMEIIVTIGT